MTRNPGTWLLLGALLSQVLGAEGIGAQTPVETRAAEDRLAAEMAGFVQDEIEGYFKSQGLPRPQLIETQTRAGFSLQDGALVVTGLSLTVKLTTDEPSPIIREARQSLARALVDRGYRLETLDGVADARPLAALTLQTVDPPPSALKRNSTKEYLVFGAILVALLASLGLLVSLLVRPLRRRRRIAARCPAQLGGESVFARSAAEAAALTGALPAMPEIPVQDTAGATDLTPPPAEEVTTPPLPRPVDPATLALRQLPFDKVLDLLIASTPEERRLLIERLDLNPLLKRRLERELLESPT